MRIAVIAKRFPVGGQSYHGVKQSGIGREFSLEDMLDSFTRKKSVTAILGVPAP